MECVLETCDPNTYVVAHGWLELEASMEYEYQSFIKNDTWDAVPRLQEI